jgi:hypothetical protein
MQLQHELGRPDDMLASTEASDYTIGLVFVAPLSAVPDNRAAKVPRRRSWFFLLSDSCGGKACREKNWRGATTLKKARTQSYHNI